MDIIGVQWITSFKIISVQVASSGAFPLNTLMKASKMVMVVSRGCVIIHLLEY